MLQKLEAELYAENVHLRSSVHQLKVLTGNLEELNHNLTQKCNTFDDMKRHTLHDKMANRVSKRASAMVDLAVFTNDFHSPSEYLDRIVVPKLMDFIPEEGIDGCVSLKTTKHSKVYIANYKEHTVCVKCSFNYNAEHEFKIIQYAGSHKCLPHCFGIGHFTTGLQECSDMLVMTYHGQDTFDKYTSSQANLIKEATNAIEILINIGSLLYHLHSRKIVHNNIRPTNILCSDPHNPYLVGFSRASPEPLCRALNAKQLKGDMYAAPELHTGTAPNCMTDVYAYGRLLSDTLMVIGSKYKMCESCVEKVKLCIHNNPHHRPIKASFLTLLSELKCFVLF
jgi:serine/threonine protein kinase